MLKIQIDTCILVEVIIRRNPEILPYFAGLYNQHSMSFLQIILPKAVQAEFYGILRAGRLTRKQQGVVSNIVLTHQQVLQIAMNYHAIFNEEFLDSLDSYSWPQGRGLDGIPLYKNTLRTVIEDEYGWNDFGEGYIEAVIRQKIKYTHIRSVDMHDFPIMATALLEEVHVLLTENTKNFIIPTGTVLVLDIKKAMRTDLYELENYLLN